MSLSASTTRNVSRTMRLFLVACLATTTTYGWCLSPPIQSRSLRKSTATTSLLPTISQRTILPSRTVSSSTVSKTSLAAAANIAVSIDQPLIRDKTLVLGKSAVAAASTASTAVSTTAVSTTTAAATTAVSTTTTASLGQTLVRPVLSLLQSLRSTVTYLTSSKSVRLAAWTFCIAVLSSWLIRTFVKTKSKTTSNNTTGSNTTLVKQWNGTLGRFQDRVRQTTTAIIPNKNPKTKGTPMPFDQTDNEGWGVCTLQSKQEPFGKTSFECYEFDLPREDYTLPLDLGQTISLCCLDNQNNVAKGDFFVYNPQPGSFSILVPKLDTTAEDLAVSSREVANFARVLQQDLQLGDEIALQPGPNKLRYQGEHLPVTDMVYVAYGTGMVPVLNQVKSILPDGSSSVASVTVIWVNDQSQDFDVMAQELEREYFKYSTKLSVSCVVVDRTEGIAHNAEIEAVLPNFQPGTMAVLSGPRDIMRKTSSYLQDEFSYPSDTICLL